jgi:hypothetical protein
MAIEIQKVYAIDPGPTQSALVVFDGVGVLNAQTLPNDELLAEISDRTRTPRHVLVVEQIASFGMPVGAEVFETCVWSGRFIQAWTGYRAPLMPWGRLKRHEVKAALCFNQRAKDPHIRQALIDRFGPGRERAIGNKANKGPLYGVRADEWAALAVAVTWWDNRILQKEIT